MKICTKCKGEQPISMYNASKSNRDKLTSWCKSCIAEYNKTYQKQNRQKLNEYNRSEEGRARTKKYRLKNKDRLKKYDYDKYWRRPEYHKAQVSAWQKANRDRKNTYMRTYLKTYFIENPGAKIAKNLRTRIYDVLANNSKSASSSELLGCSVGELVIYLENKFSTGMSWDNYGKNGWELDHIIPCASFDLTDPEQQKKCFHYTNLQPLWELDNRKKSDTIMCHPTQYTGFTRVDKTSHIPSVPSKNCTPNNFGMVFAV